MRFSSKNLAIFYEQMGTMIRAGVPIQKALGSLRQTSPRSMRPVISQIAERVNSGEKLNESMALHFDRFAPMDYRGLAVAEQSGALDAGLFALADYHARRDAAQGRMISASIIPFLVLLFAVFIVPLPNLVLGITGGRNYSELDYLRDTVGLLALLIGGILGSLLLGKTLFHVPSLALPLDRLLRAIPIFGRVRFDYALARWLQSIRLMLNAGYGLIEAMQFSTEMVNSPILSKTFDQIHPHINSQLEVSQLLAQTRVFPDVVLQLWGTGEQSGKLDEMLEKAIQICEERWRKSMDRLAAWLPRVIYGLVCLYIVFQIFKFALAYTKQIQDAMQM